MRQFHKLIESPHTTIEKLDAFIQKNGPEYLCKFTLPQARGRGGNNALIAAIRAERFDLAEHFLKRKYLEHYDPDIVDVAHGRSPLTWAIILHHPEITFALLQQKVHKVDVTRADVDGCTALYWAVSMRSSYAVVNALVKRGADPNQVLVDDANRATFLLHEFVSANDWEASKQLITQFKAHADPLDMVEELYEAEISSSLEELELAGVTPVPAAQLTSLTASTEGISSFDLRASAEITSAGLGEASEDSASDDEVTEGEDDDDEEDLPDPPIIFALQQKTSSGFDTFKLLAESWLAPVSVESAVRTLRIHFLASFAIILNHLDALKWLIVSKYHNVNFQDPEGRTLLHSALGLDAENNILSFLMEDCRCRDDIKDKNGFTALQLGALVFERKGQELAAKLLEQAPASVEEPAPSAAWGALDEAVSEAVSAALLAEPVVSSASSGEIQPILLALPTEMKLIILSSLHAKELCKFQRASKDARALGRSDVLWRSLTIKVFGGDIRNHVRGFAQSWMKSFRQKLAVAGSHCHLCKSSKNLKTCGCEVISYCSNQCRNGDLIFHGRSCVKLQSDIRWAKLLYKSVITPDAHY